MDSFGSYEHIKKELTADEFDKVALDIFRFQAAENPVYSEYIKYLGIVPDKVDSIYKIPFLPIEFFKTRKVITGFNNLPEDKFRVFRSSGTTGMTRSSHYVYDTGLYEKSFVKGFEYFYSSPEDYVFLALLPSYLERGDSSLIYMVSRLIELSQNEHSGFYLYNHSQLYEKLLYLRDNGIKTILIGVSFALLDFGQEYNIDFPELIVMETGGMKGRRKEMVRSELHEHLKNTFGVEGIHSEYGMTELLSQAYSKGEGKFFTPPWMRILVRDMNDPFSYVEQGRTGGINVIDLANIYSCSFIETKDLGRINNDGSFEISGRFDNTDLRGCNLMVV